MLTDRVPDDNFTDNDQSICLTNWAMLWLLTEELPEILQSVEEMVKASNPEKFSTAQMDDFLRRFVKEPLTASRLGKHTVVDLSNL